MKDPKLPPPSQPWGRELSALIDETSSGVEQARNDVDVRMRGLAISAQSLVGQSDMVTAAINSTQPLRIAFSEVLGLSVGTDPSPVTKVTTIIPLPAGYNAVMFQAYGNGYMQNFYTDSTAPESQIVASAPGAVTVSSSVQPAPFQDDSANMRRYVITPSFTAFMPNVTGSLTVQIRMRTRAGLVMNNGANTIALLVMANFYKGKTLLPPA